MGAYNVSGRNWGWELYGEGFTQDYRADVGFFQRTNSNFNSFFIRYNSDPNPKKRLSGFTGTPLTMPNTTGRAGCMPGSTKTSLSCNCRVTVGSVVSGNPAERTVRSRVWTNAKAKNCDPAGLDWLKPVNDARPRCTFFGPSNERSSSKQHLGVFAGSNFNKQIQLNGQIVHRWGHFDFDFGNGDKYPRVSPAALALAELSPG